MRGLAKILMVVGLASLIGVAAWALSNWRADKQKQSAVVVVIDPPELGSQIIPLRGRASLYAGDAHEVTANDTSVDDAEEVNLEAAEEPRFTLVADATDGTRFFVYAWMEMSNYEIYCDSIQLPEMRARKQEDGTVWVDAKTGRPLETLHVKLRKKCDDPQAQGGA